MSDWLPTTVAAARLWPRELRELREFQAHSRIRDFNQNLPPNTKRWSASHMPPVEFPLLHTVWPKQRRFDKALPDLKRKGFIDEEDAVLAEQILQSTDSVISLAHKAFEARGRENDPFTPGPGLSSRFTPAPFRLGGWEGAYSAPVVLRELKKVRYHVQPEPSPAVAPAPASGMPPGPSIPPSNFDPPGTHSSPDNQERTNEVEGAQLLEQLSESLTGFTIDTPSRPRTLDAVGVAASSSAPAPSQPSTSSAMPASEPTDPGEHTKFEPAYREFYDIHGRALLATTLGLSIAHSITILPQEHNYVFGKRPDLPKGLFNARTDGHWYKVFVDVALSFMSFEVKRDRREGSKEVPVCRQEAATMAAMIWAEYDLGDSERWSTSTVRQAFQGPQQRLILSLGDDTYTLITVEFGWEWINYLRKGDTRLNSNGFATFTRYGTFRITVPDEMKEFNLVVLSLVLRQLRKMGPSGQYYVNRAQKRLTKLEAIREQHSGLLSQLQCDFKLQDLLRDEIGQEVIFGVMHRMSDGTKEETRKSEAEDSDSEAEDSDSDAEHLDSDPATTPSGHGPTAESLGFSDMPSSSGS